MNETMKKAFTYPAVLVTGAVVGALALKTFGDPSALLPGADRQSKQAVLASLSIVPPVTRSGDPNPVAAAAAKLEPAVVSIHTVGKIMQASAGEGGSPFGDDPIFRRFFGMPGGPQGGAPGGGEATRGAGSGVIISPDGYVLTNNHVVENTSKVTVNVGDKGYDARVIGTDPMTDIAVVKINTGGTRLTPAQLGNSDDLRVGDWAIAVGNPLDVGTTVTLGIISATNRTGLAAENHPLNSVIQTDAAINPGNSGGALADINGRVIGINEAIYSPTGSYVGIGFAIPINSARKIATDLIKDGQVVRPYLGVAYKSLKAFPPDARAQMGISLQGDNGVVVSGVAPGSPAAQAGLKTYDVILEANRQPLTSEDALNKLIQGQRVGSTVVLLVSHNGQNRIVSVTLKQRPNSFDENFGQSQQPQDEQPQGVPMP